MKTFWLALWALTAALAHGEIFHAPHMDATRQTITIDGTAVALTPEVAQLHEHAVATLFSGQARAAIPLLDQAIAQYEQHFAADPRQRYAAASRAYAHNELGELVAGKADLDALLALSPANAQALNERGYYYQREKNWQAAAADFKQAAEYSQWIEDPATRQNLHAAAQRGLGFTLIERGRWQEAEAIYQKLLQENPQDARARNELEYIRQQREKHPPL